MRTAHINKLFKRKAEEIAFDREEKKRQQNRAEQEQKQRQNLLVGAIGSDLERVARNARQLVRNDNEFSDFVRKTKEFCILTENRPTYKPKGEPHRDSSLGIRNLIQRVDTLSEYYVLIHIAEVKLEDEKVLTIVLDVSCAFGEINFRNINVRCGKIVKYCGILTFHDYIHPSDEIVRVLDKLSTPEGFIESFLLTHAHIL